MSQPLPALTAPLRLGTPRVSRPVMVPGRLWLAPMEGITDAWFRQQVAALGGLGAASTDYLRIAGSHFGRGAIRKRLGDALPGVPCAVQFMASVADEALARSMSTAVDLGADWIDLNFGCPAPRVVANCAGSALLDQPQVIAEIVACAVAASDRPVTAKIRAGISDTAHLHEVVAACLEAGASGITVHARLRSQSYAREPTWSWIAEVVDLVRARDRGVAVIGNGGVRTPADAQAMMAQTGCDAVVVGHGAVSDPWLFQTASGGQPPSPQAAAAWLSCAAHDLIQRVGRGPAQGRIRQFLRYWIKGPRPAMAALAGRLLREPDLEVILQALSAAAEKSLPRS